MAKGEKAVTKKEKTDVAILVDMEKDKHAGFEETDKDSFAIPFILILQTNSPQVDPDSGVAIPKAKSGMFFNTVTEELFDGEKGLHIIPCHYKRSLINWQDRKSGGGFIKEYPANDPIQNTTTKNEKGQDVLPDGTILVDTRNHFCLLLRDKGITEAAIISMSSTQAKKSRKWMTRMSTMQVAGSKGLFTPPMFSQIWKITTVPESNEKGNWRGFQINHVRQVDNVELYSKAKAFHALVQAGNVEPAGPTPQDDTDF